MAEEMSGHELLAALALVFAGVAMVAVFVVFLIALWTTRHVPKFPPPPSSPFWKNDNDSH